MNSKTSSEPLFPSKLRGIKPTRSTHFSFYLQLLQKSVNDISIYKEGLTDEEFNLLAKQDESFRKNLQLDLKDITLISNLLVNNLTS